jgi:15-cis-phytoene synthase
MSGRPPSTSAEITRRAKSNLAFALLSLPKERRRDMVSFYAFCRVADDIADDDGLPLSERQAQLHAWKSCILDGTPAPDPLLTEVVALAPKYGFELSLLAEIIDGVASDLNRDRFETFDELLKYCYQVASAVGLVSICIFGHRHPATRQYAIHLGYALQLTNILRDVGQDARDTGRIYLPVEDLRKFGVTEQQIFENRYDAAFQALMVYQYERAKAFYQQAEDDLPEQDRQAMVAAEMMGQIYFEILKKLKHQEFQVFGPRIGLHPLRKGLILLAYLLRTVIRAI